MVAANFAWNPVFDCITKETSDAGAAIAVYTQEPKHHGGLISQSRSSTSSFYHYDAIGTTRALTAANQATSDSAVYTAFGEKVDSVGTTVNPFGFVGNAGYYESVSHSVEVRARYYSVQQGRWKSRDPENSAISIYKYATNRPLIAVNPLGWVDIHEMEDGKISEDEKKSLAGCKCKVIPASTIQAADVLAFIGCRDGKPSLYFNQLEKSIEKIGQWKDCGFLECTLDHENTHIRHYDHFCPGVCKTKTSTKCGAGEDAELKDITAPVFDTTACQNASECYGYLNDFKCWRRKIDGFDKMEKSERDRLAPCIRTMVSTIKKKLEVTKTDYKCSWTDEDAKLITSITADRERYENQYGTATM